MIYNNFSLIRNTWHFPTGLCSDVLVDTCYKGCSDFTVNNCPSSSFCQVACIANQECKSWTFDKVEQVNVKSSDTLGGSKFGFGGKICA